MVKVSAWWLSMSNTFMLVHGGFSRSNTVKFYCMVGLEGQLW